MYRYEKCSFKNLEIGREFYPLCSDSLCVKEGEKFASMVGHKMLWSPDNFDMVVPLTEGAPVGRRVVPYLLGGVPTGDYFVL